MKKKLSLLLIMTSILFGNAYEDTFIKEKGLDVLPEEIKVILEKDKFYKLAILQLTNKEHMANQEVKSGDPHQPDSVKKVTVTVPNFVKALDNFKKSYKEHSNPISSFAITHLIKTSFGKKNHLEDFAYYSEKNYLNKLCSGYIDYGEVLQKGYFQKVNIEGAKKVYEEGAKQCKIGWYAAVISAKLLSF